MANLSFSVGFWPTVGVGVGLAMLLSLGTWQFGKYQVKAEREELRDERGEEPPVRIASLAEWREKGVDYRRVEVVGSFDAGTVVVVEQRTHEGDPGAWVLQPLEFDEGDGEILVNRGWVPFEKVRSSVESFVSAESGTFTGLGHRVREPVADESMRGKLEAGEAELEGETTRWHSLDVPGMYDHLSAETPEEPTLAILGPDHSGDPYPIASYDYVTEPYLTSERHLSYAVFWYAVAVALFGLWLAAGFGALQSRQRGRRKE